MSIFDIVDFSINYVSYLWMEVFWDFLMVAFLLGV